MRAYFVTTNYTAGASAPAGYFAPPEYCNTTADGDA
jgi:hypothetical protein